MNESMDTQTVTVREERLIIHFKNTEELSFVNKTLTNMTLSDIITAYKLGTPEIKIRTVRRDPNYTAVTTLNIKTDKIDSMELTNTVVATVHPGQQIEGTKW